MSLPQKSEVVIIGGGITGASIAYYLAKKGVKDILLLEKNMMGEGATGKCAGGIRDIDAIIRSAGYRCIGEGGIAGIVVNINTLITRIGDGEAGEIGCSGIVVEFDAVIACAGDREGGEGKRAGIVVEPDTVICRIGDRHIGKGEGAVGIGNIDAMIARAGNGAALNIDDRRRRHIAQQNATGWRIAGIGL